MYRSTSIRRYRVATCTDASIGNVQDPNHSGGMEQPYRSGPRVPSVLRSALHPITSREWKTEIMTSADPATIATFSRVTPVSSFSPARLRVTDIPLQCATKPVVAGFSPRSLSSKRTILSSRRTVVYLHPANASRHQRKSLFSYPVRFGLSLAVDPRVRVHNERR